MYRQKLNYITVLVVAAVLFFAACKKDSNSSSSSSSGSNSSNGNNTGDITSIEASNVVNSTSDIANVKLIFSNHDNGNDIYYEFTTAKYKNNGFKLELPETLQDKYLFNAADYCYGRWGVDSAIISDKQAKILGYDFYIVAYNSAGMEIGEFYVNSNLGGLYYVYADRNFTVSSHFTVGRIVVERNCSFSKGWNIEYWDETNTKSLNTTTKPTGFNYWWEYRSYEGND